MHLLRISVYIINWGMDKYIIILLIYIAAYLFSIALKPYYFKEQ